MKKILLPFLAVSALLLNACSTTQLARQADGGEDDVYYTEAKAKVITPVAVSAQTREQENSYRTDEQLYGDDTYYDDRFANDYSYSARINRFYYNSPFRPYYDYRFSYGYNPWNNYTYDPFFYDPWLFRPGLSLSFNIGRNPWNWNNNFYGFNNGFNNGYWGPYSYYNTYPGYGYGGGGNVYVNPNARSRPNREGGVGYSSNGSQGNGALIPSGSRPSRGSVAPGRATPDGRISSGNGNSSGNNQPSNTRPTRTQQARAPRQETAPAPRQQEAPREYSRPERSSAPAPSSGGNSGSSGSSGGSSSGSRPTRGNR